MYRGFIAISDKSLYAFNYSPLNSNIMDLQIIQSKIYEIRGCRVMLDSDLAALYQVETKALKQAVKRNIERFPSDFMFELTKEEVECLRSQIVTLKNNPDETEEETSSVANT